MLKKVLKMQALQKLGAALCVAMMCTTMGKADGASLQLSLGGGEILNSRQIYGTGNGASVRGNYA